MPQQNRYPQAYKNWLQIGNETGTNGGVTEIYLGGERDRDRDKRQRQTRESEVALQTRRWENKWWKDTRRFYWNKKLDSKIILITK